jgi:hypothetical protein
MGEVFALVVLSEAERDEDMMQKTAHNIVRVVIIE